MFIRIRKCSDESCDYQRVSVYQRCDPEASRLPVQPMAKESFSSQLGLPSATKRSDAGKDANPQFAKIINLAFRISHFAFCQEIVPFSGYSLLACFNARALPRLMLYVHRTLRQLNNKVRLRCAGGHFATKYEMVILQIGTLGENRFPLSLLLQQSVYVCM